ncbi:hypothetical protein Pfo_018017 [Paulownia fortunei]|nr:hypothetical protein Pfo_018017 [Paulownia fortunei]
MNPTALLIYRRLLQVAEVENVSEISSLSPTTVAGDPSFLPINSSSTAAVRRPFNPNTHFDSSMALTILVLLTALFFMGFFSVYIRRFTAAEDPSPPSPASVSRRPPPPPNHKRGLDPSAVNSLPLVAYGKAARHQMIDDCPICLSEFQERETVKLIPYCGHVFHSRCIDTWLSLHVTCPLCRSAQLFKRVEEGLFGCEAGEE